MQLYSGSCTFESGQLLHDRAILHEVCQILLSCNLIERAGSTGIKFVNVFCGLKDIFVRYSSNSNSLGDLWLHFRLDLSTVLTFKGSNSEPITKSPSGPWWITGKLWGWRWLIFWSRLESIFQIRTGHTTIFCAQWVPIILRNDMIYQNPRVRK